MQSLCGFGNVCQDLSPVAVPCRCLATGVPEHAYRTLSEAFRDEIVKIENPDSEHGC